MIHVYLWKAIYRNIIYGPKRFDYKIVTVDGDINFSNVTRLREKISNFIDDSPMSLVMDLKNVYIIDSTGITAIYELHKKVEALKGTFYLANMNEIVENIITLTGIKFKTIELKEE